LNQVGKNVHDIRERVGFSQILLFLETCDKLSKAQLSRCSSCFNKSVLSMIC